MHEQNVRDYQQAKQKARDKLGLPDRSPMPRNDEIQSALVDYLKLFKPDTQHLLIKRLRQSAMQSMRFLSKFEPRLVGSVLHGTADEYAPVQIHVFAEPPELILQYLLDHNISYKLASKRIQYCDGRVQSITMCDCVADGVATELMLFKEKDLREAPKSPIDGKPMQRMNLRELEALLSEGNP